MKKGLLPLAVFAGTAFLLIFVQWKVDRPMLMLEVLAEGGGWLEIFLTGAYAPSLFDTSHTVVWQTVVILFGVILWIFWASKFATKQEAATS